MFNKLFATFVSLFITASAFTQTDPNAKIDLSLVPSTNQVELDQTFEVSLMMNAQTTPQRYFVSDIIFGWNPNELEFVGISHENSHPFIMLPISGLPYCPPGQSTGCGDFYGINEVLPPVDGNGLYQGYGQLGEVWIVDSQPVQIVKFIFKVIAPFETTEISFIPQLTVNYPHSTRVYGSYIPGLEVTGTLTNAVVEFSRPLLGDFNLDGAVDSGDLAMLLANWGTISFGENPYDLSGNGIVDGADLSILFSNWK